MKVAPIFKPLFPHIYHAGFQSQRYMNNILFRIAEYDPEDKSMKKLSDKSLASFLELSSSSSDWGGYCIFGDGLTQFYKKMNRYFLDGEKLFFETVKEEIPRKIWLSQKFCVLATWRNVDIDHELAHAFYYLFPRYRRTMDSMVRDWPYRDRAEKLLILDGYEKQDVKDEIQALLATSNHDFLENTYGFRKSWRVPKKFRKVFEDFKRDQAEKNLIKN